MKGQSKFSFLVFIFALFSFFNSYAGKKRDRTPPSSPKKTSPASSPTKKITKEEISAEARRKHHMRNLLGRSLVQRMGDPCFQLDLVDGIPLPKNEMEKPERSLQNLSSSGMEIETDEKVDDVDMNWGE